MFARESRECLFQNGRLSASLLMRAKRHGFLHGSRAAAIVLAVAVVALRFLEADSGLPGLGVILMAFSTLVAVESDLRSRTIPNWLNYGVLGSILVCSGMLTWTSPNRVENRWCCLPLDQAVIGGGVCFTVMFFLFLYAGTGGGDVKLATAWGAALGVELGVMVIALAYIIACLVWPCIHVLSRDRGEPSKLSGVPMALFFSLSLIALLMGVRLW